MKDEKTILSAGGEHLLVIHGRGIDFESGTHITIMGKTYRVVGRRWCAGELEFYLEVTL